MVTVHRDVDDEFTGHRVRAPNGDRPHHRFLAGRQIGEGVERQRVRQGGHIDVLGRENQFDVRIGELAGSEGVEAVAAEHNSNHVRGELFGAHYFERVHWSTGHLIPFLGH